GAVTHGRRAAFELMSAGFVVDVLDTEAVELGLTDCTPVTEVTEGTEIVLALGGDGTVLRGADLASPAHVPLYGVNFGRMGFLTGAEVEDLDQVLRQVVDRGYHITTRMTLDVEVTHRDEYASGPTNQWALNEASLERSPGTPMLEVLLSVDGEPVSRWGCDGVVCATPTGSTAHAFSAGGPVMWPNVDALLVVPNAAHALFSRPLVIGPDSQISLTAGGATDARLACDGRRGLQVHPGDIVWVRRGGHPLFLANLTPPNFAHRLVAKFQLPVAGWRRDRTDDKDSGGEATVDNVVGGG
ncbi:MAG: NAD kinase, partial [Mycobacteriales bacterium]